jgi:hypothetical protein
MILDYNRPKLGLLAARCGGCVKALLVIIAAGALAACAGSSEPGGDVAANAAIAPPPVVSIDPATDEASVTIRVMTWNVEGLPLPIRFGRAHALEEIGDALASMRARGEAPHILLIQEGFMRKPMERLISRSGYAYVSRGPRAGDDAAGSAQEMGEPWRLRGEGLGKVLDGGLYILSDFPILDTQTEAFAPCAGFDCLANKGVMLARIRIPGAPDPLAVLNTQSRAPTWRTAHRSMRWSVLSATLPRNMSRSFSAEISTWPGRHSAGPTLSRWSRMRSRTHSACRTPRTAMFPQCLRRRSIPGRGKTSTDFTMARRFASARSGWRWRTAPQRTTPSPITALSLSTIV